MGPPTGHVAEKSDENPAGFGTAAPRRLRPALLRCSAGLWSARQALRCERPKGQQLVGAPHAGAQPFSDKLTSAVKRDPMLVMIARGAQLLDRTLMRAFLAQIRETWRVVVGHARGRGARGGLSASGVHEESVLGRLADQAQVRLSAFVIRACFEVVEDELIDRSYMPSWIRERATNALTHTCNTVLQRASATADSRIWLRQQERRRLFHQRQGRLRFWRHAFRSARAFILYTLMPADETLWFQLRQPAFWCVVAALLVPCAGICDLAFFALYCMISRHDEYQLCAFIIFAKAQQFLLSVVSLTTWMFSVVGCMFAIDDADTADASLVHAIMANPDFSSSAGLRSEHLASFSTRFAPCKDSFDRQSNFARAVQSATLALDVLRTLTLWHAYFMLRCRSRGDQALEALDAIRPDVERESAESIADRYAELRRLQAADAASKKSGGRLMAVLIGLDLFGFVQATVTNVALFAAAGKLAYGQHQWWLAWFMYEAHDIAEGLWLLPFVVVAAMPIEFVTGSARTGYDRRGTLCPNLDLHSILEIRLQRERLESGSESAV